MTPALLGCVGCSPRLEKRGAVWSCVCVWGVAGSVVLGRPRGWGKVPWGAPAAGGRGGGGGAAPARGTSVPSDCHTAVAQGARGERRRPCRFMARAALGKGRAGVPWERLRRFCLGGGGGCDGGGGG